MKRLDYLKMERIEGGTDNWSAWQCGAGVAIAVFGTPIFGPLAYLGVAACIKGDS